jgi:RNase P subunit RPR2
MTDNNFARVKIPGDVMQLMRLGFFVTLEPPYWYLRCRHCNQRFYLPWDARLRTEEAHEILLAHGKQCDAIQRSDFPESRVSAHALSPNLPHQTPRRTRY